MLNLDEIKIRLSNHRTHPSRDVFEKRASVSLVFRNDFDNGPQILFIKRVINPLDPWSGHMAFPGGHIDLGESPLEAAIRETKEELSINLLHSNFLGNLDDFQVHFKGHPINFIIHPHVFFMRGEREELIRPDQNEVDQWFWIDLDFFNRQENMNFVPYKLGENQIELPCFAYSSGPIWGISYLILMDLFKKLEGLKLPQNIGNLEFRSSHWIHYPHYSKSYK